MTSNVINLAATQGSRKFTMQRLADVFDVSAPDHIVVQVFNDRTDFVPEVDPSYVFNKEQLKRVLQWLNGTFGKNLSLTGPTGCGKSTLIEQVAARLNIEVFRLACHGKLEFPETLGTTQLVPGALAHADGLLGKAAAVVNSLANGALDGESLLQWAQRSFSGGVVSRYQDGPAVLAAKRGAILLLDEANFLHPSTFGAYNTLLDGGALLIPETGEAVQPLPGFRIAITGNAMDGGDDMSLYRGVQRMSVAMQNRFLNMKCDYMPPVQECMVLGKVVTLPGALVDCMIEVANDTRRSFKDGTIETTISTRVLLRWARLIQAQRDRLAADAPALIAEALDFALLDGANQVDAEAIRKVLLKTIENKTFAVPSSAQPGAPQRNPAIRLFVHPNNGSPKYWGCVLRPEQNEEDVFFAAMGSAAEQQTKPTGYFARNSGGKLNKGYLEVQLPAGAGHPSLSAVRELLVDKYNALRQGSVASVPRELEGAMRQLLTAIGRQEWLTKVVA